jgi:hypothetical protein
MPISCRTRSTGSKDSRYRFSKNPPGNLTGSGLPRFTTTCQAGQNRTIIRSANARFTPYRAKPLRSTILPIRQGRTIWSGYPETDSRFGPIRAGRRPSGIQTIGAECACKSGGAQSHGSSIPAVLPVICSGLPGTQAIAGRDCPIKSDMDNHAVPGQAPEAGRITPLFPGFPSLFRVYDVKSQDCFLTINQILLYVMAPHNKPEA